MPSMGHSVTNSSGPGGGRGHTQKKKSDRFELPPPPPPSKIGAVGGSGAPYGEIWRFVTFEPSANWIPNRSTSLAGTNAPLLRHPWKPSETISCPGLARSERLKLKPLG